MKIDRAKLNTLLRSGLNPNIKTRKQLAAHLGLDPTSLTRWFATRDRLGNPRYPVVPDRHMAKIFQLFNLDPDSLSLNDEDFRHYCFENALSQSKHQDDLEEKNKRRLENAAQRRLAISDYSATKSKVPFQVVVTLSSLFFVLIAWYFINQKLFTDLNVTSTINKVAVSKEVCWTGYSPSLGAFEKEDKSDPCHYGKLFHNALTQLKIENERLSLSHNAKDISGTHAYIAFLFEKLEHRRITDNITLNIELGKSEWHRSNFHAAYSYFQKANKLLTTLPNQNPQVSAEISRYVKKLSIKLN